MLYILDEGVGNITATLEATGVGDENPTPHHPASNWGCCSVYLRTRMGLHVPRVTRGGVRHTISALCLPKLVAGYFCCFC